MAFLGSVKRECEIRNRRNRNVRESNVPLRLNEYWSNASGQNFIVTGGSEKIPGASDHIERQRRL